MTELQTIQSLVWRKIDDRWQLFAGKRRFGKVMPDRTHPGMWRTPLENGRASDMGNLSWARHAVMEAAVRELEYEAKGNAPSISSEIEGVFRTRSSHSDLSRSGVPDLGGGAP